MKTKSSKILISAVALIFLSLIISTIQPTSVWADGTETLGPPSIPIGSGSGIVAAGTGLVAQPSTIDINVPGDVVQALLYWEGQMSTNVPGDGTIVLNGVDITGSLIGGQTFFFGGAYSSAFRADITSLVNSGANSFQVSGCDFTEVCNGAGVMVIYDDGSSTAEIELRDGLDLAFFGFPEPRKSTVPQTFSFAPSSSDRLATLDMFFSSVSGSVSGGGPIRPSEINITVDGISTSFLNELDSKDGDEWDTLSTAVTIPADATSLTVEAISTNSDDPLGASFTWLGAALSLPVEIEEPGTGRFTGGGNQIRVDGVRVTRGLTIHCDLLLSNNLEVNWQGNSFHMTEHLVTVSCTDDPDIIQAPPPAPLDTLVGVGTGRYNGEDGFTIEFTLVDAGEPGRDDKASLLIYETANLSNVVLNVPLQLLDHGNLQAHEDQPHK